MKASLVFKNGVVYTADAGRTIAEAVAVVDGKIAYVGDNAGVQAYVSAETEVVDLAGKMLLPSFLKATRITPRPLQRWWALTWPVWTPKRTMWLR